MFGPTVDLIEDEDGPTIEINQGPFGVSLTLEQAHLVLDKLQAALFIYAGTRLAKTLEKCAVEEEPPRLRLVK